MKKTQISIFVLLVLFLLSKGIAVAQNSGKKINNIHSLKLMSYNIKFDSPAFKPAWEVRREWQVEMIKKYSPDIIGTQEGLKKQVDYLQNELSEYVAVGEGRKGGDDDEHMAIFFKRDKYRLREMGSFQLSKTPDIIGSGPTVNPRMVTWVRLAVITQNEHQYPDDYRGHWENAKEFYVLNTHFFNGKRDTLARLNAAKLILEKVDELSPFGSWETERPIFLMGDFNCLPESDPYKVLVASEPEKYSTRFTDCIDGGKGIDWILYKGKVQINYYEQVEYNVNGVYPSDHKPIYVESQF